MKKGATHVDWAISMAIFLVYVLLMFIFLKPATEPTYNENSMFDTVYSGLKNDTSYTIKKGYFLIKPTSDVSESREYILRIRNLDTSGMNMDWVAQDPAGHLTLVNESLKDANCKNIQAVQFDFKDDNPPSNRKVLEMKTYLKSGEDNVFWFLYSEDIAYEPHPTVNTLGLTDAECVKREGTPPTKKNDCLLDSKVETPSDITNFTYQFGVVETFTAFSEEKLKTLNQTYYNQYEALKGNWSFPTDKNFNITIERLS